MPATFTYDVTDIDNNDRTRIRSAFERFGWEHLGGSVFRYPRFDQNGAIEDWLNHVIPAVMFFRSFVLHRGLTLSAFTLDCQSLSCFKANTANAGAGPSSGPGMPLMQPTNVQMAEQGLRDWIDGCTNAVP